MEQLLAQLPPGDCSFWATQSGAELDLLVVVDGKPIGFEFKVSDAPKLTRSMSIACQDLGLHRLVVVSPASARYPLADRIDVMPLPEAIAEVCSGRID